MFCVEVGNDDMEVHWFKDGLKLHETHQTILKSFGKTHILVFVGVAYHDSGVVTFVTGRSKTSSRLKVKGTLWTATAGWVYNQNKPTIVYHFSVDVTYLLLINAKILFCGNRLS